jgi:hypothetical protein
MQPSLPRPHSQPNFVREEEKNPRRQKLIYPTAYLIKFVPERLMTQNAEPPPTPLFRVRISKLLKFTLGQSGGVFFLLVDCDKRRHKNNEQFKVSAQTTKRNKAEKKTKRTNWCIREKHVISNKSKKLSFFSPWEVINSEEKGMQFGVWSVGRGGN